MTQDPNNRVTDLRGASKLTVDAVSGVTDIAESLHQTIASLSGLVSDPNQTRTTGITGLVYRNIRFMTGLVGTGIDVPLGQLSKLLGEQKSSPARESVLAVLNGILGDHLVVNNNPLAIPMQFRQNGESINPQALSEAIQQADGKLLILVHGSCMNDLQWQRNGHDHGQALASEFGYEPIYLHYNSGLHISENGRLLSQLLESLVEQSSQPLELTILAHSMGGLVARSACHDAQKSDRTWLPQLQKLFFLGTPHHGAPLEKGGNWVDFVLTVNPYSAPFSRLGKIRSSGVTDMRYGNVVAEDWQGQDRFSLSVDQRIPVPLPVGVACYTIAATTSMEFDMFGEDVIGDGLVMVNSALGKHQEVEMTLLFPESQQRVVRDSNHMDLLDHPAVYETIRAWLEDR